MEDKGHAEEANPDTDTSESPASMARRERLNLLQLESLGTKRRDYISTRDFRENTGPGVSLEVVEASRLSNVPGTEEHRQSQAHQQELSAWNTAFSFLADDGTMDEELEDINQGQTHRARLMAEIPTSLDDDHSYGVDHHDRYGGDRPRGSDRTRAGAKGGRGGGTAGSKTIPRFRRRIQPGCLEERFCSEFDQNSASPTAGSLLVTVNRMSELRNLSVAHQDKNKCSGGEAQQVRTPQRRTAPVSTKWEQILASPSVFMASLAKASSDPLEMKRTDDLDPAEIEKRSEGNKVVETFETHVEKSENIDRGREFTDILISTDIDPLPWTSPNFGISYPSAGEKSPVSYSSDLIGLDMAAGSNMSIAADHDREKIHLSMSKSTSPPTNQTLAEVVAYLSANLPVIRQALELDLWPQLELIITRLEVGIENAKDSLMKLPQVSDRKLFSDKTADGLTRGSETASTSSAIHSRGDTIVLQSHGAADNILASAKVSKFLSESEAPAESTEISKADLELKEKYEKRTDSKKTLIRPALPAGKCKDTNLSVVSGFGLTSHGQLAESLATSAASANIPNASAELKGKEADFAVSIDKMELKTVPKAIVEAQSGLMGERGPFEGQPENQDHIPTVGAPEQIPKSHGEYEEPRGYLNLSDEANVTPQIETHQIQGLGISSVTEAYQPSLQPDLDTSKLLSVSQQMKSHSIFGTHLMPGQAKRERTLSLGHSVSSPSTDKPHIDGDGDNTGLWALSSKSSFFTSPPTTPSIEHVNTPEGLPLNYYGTREAPFPPSGDSVQSRFGPSYPHPQHSLSSKQSGLTEVQDRPKLAVGPSRKFQPFSFARAGPSKMLSPGLFKESSQVTERVAERMASSPQPEFTSKSTTKTASQAGTAILCTISNPLSVKSPSVFVNTYLPIRPSRFNSTGLFAPENQRPVAKRPVK